jgi:peptide/nickel transport system permease protein
VLVEIVFAYPGLGDVLFRAVRRYDYFVVSGLVYVMAVSIAIATFAIDVLYVRLDPRVRQTM